MLLLMVMFISLFLLFLSIYWYIRVDANIVHMAAEANDDYGDVDVTYSDCRSYLPFRRNRPDIHTYQSQRNILHFQLDSQYDIHMDYQYYLLMTVSLKIIPKKDNSQK